MPGYAAHVSLKWAVTFEAYPDRRSAAEDLVDGVKAGWK